MSALVESLRKPITHVALFGLFALLLSWPSLSVVGAWHDGFSLLVFLFVNWGFIVVLLLLIGRSVHDDVDEEERPE